MSSADCGVQAGSAPDASERQPVTAVPEPGAVVGKITRPDGEIPRADGPADAAGRATATESSGAAPSVRLRRQTSSKPPGALLALAVHRGETGAIEALVREYQDQLLDYALRLLHDEFEAQEVTQDAFLRAHHALTSTYDAERCRTLELRPWLFRIVRNLAYNRLRSERLRQPAPLPAGDAWHEPALRDDPKAEGTLLAGEESRRLELALERLPLQSRELVTLRFLEELSYAEIASLTGGSEVSARGKVFRAVRQLRSLLTNEEWSHAV
jgi:RNA polymerase sigma-70 factor (ECF subfamily)